MEDTFFKLILLFLTLNMNAYVMYKADGTRYILHTDLTRTDSHFKANDHESEPEPEPEPEPDDFYCHGCESGADCIHAHCDECNRLNGFI